MRAWDIKPQRSLAIRLKRAYRYSELYKLRCWLKGKTLHWALYLTVASVALGAVLGLHNYLHGFYFVVCVGDREVGYVRDAADIEGFVVSLTERCSLNYGMAVEPREPVSLHWDYRPDAESDAHSVKEALRQSITMVTDALMITVDQAPVVPVATEQDVESVIEFLSSAYVSQADNVKLLEASLVEEVCGEQCTVRPEEVYSAEDVASLLVMEEPGRELIALSRGVADVDIETAALEIPLVHVNTVEEETVKERIPFNTEYTYTSSLWSAQSRVITPGEDGSKEVVYHVTRENGLEVERAVVSERVLDEPVTQVVERGTASAPTIGTGQFVWPVAGGGLLTSRFSSWHPGIDIAAPSGTSVLAVDSGVVVISECIPWPQGNYIVIYHGQYYSLYMHNSANLVSAGSTVSRGQVIAAVGSTGNSTGPHLHFELRRSVGGSWNHWNYHPAVDPLAYFRP